MVDAVQELQQTITALQVMLEEESTFKEVVNTVHAKIDRNQNGKLEREEIQQFLNDYCESNGTTPPQAYQVQVVYQQLDLNGDGGISLDELSVFLKHFFTEQLHQAEEKLNKLHPRPPRPLQQPTQPTMPKLSKGFSRRLP